MAELSKKRPAFQWYPGDFRRDTALQACSFAARGLWREMIDLMHDGEPYGHLTAGGVALDADQLARLVGESRSKVSRWLDELEVRKVFSRTEGGIIYSRRMVRDENSRNFAAESGDESTRPPAGKRTGKPGALFNFLLEKWTGCLVCGTTDALELHRIIPGRRGGRYTPGNVLLLCHLHHMDAGAGELSVAQVLAARSGVATPDALFAGFNDRRFPKGINEGIESDTPPDTPTIPSAVAVAVASAVALQSSPPKPPAIPPIPAIPPAPSAPSAPPAPSAPSAPPAPSAPSAPNPTSPTAAPAFAAMGPVASLLVSDADRSALDELMAIAPNPLAWYREISVSLDGMPGHTHLTPTQLGTAIRDYVANGAAKDPNLRHFRSYLARAARGERVGPSASGTTTAAPNRPPPLSKQERGRENIASAIERRKQEATSRGD